MAGGACAIVGFFLLIICGVHNIRIGMTIAAGIGAFGFISSLRMYLPEKKSMNKIFRIIEMIVCAFIFVFCGIWILLGI